MNLSAYLLLVSFIGGSPFNMSMDQLSMVTASPYHGVAISIADAYDTNSYTIQDYDNFCQLLSAAQQSGKWNKHIWPMVYLNRFIAVSNSFRWDGRKVPPYYAKIKALDIYNEAGALKCFYQDWNNALMLSRSTNSPGIILDDEFYNSPTLPLEQIAAVHGQTEDNARETLRGIGANLIKTAAKIKPDVVILVLMGWMSDLPKVDLKPMEDPRLYIFTGMLEQAKGSKIKIIAGGETDLGYCFLDEEDLLRTIDRRKRLYAPIESKYPDNFILGGTVAPWDNLNWRKESNVWTRNKGAKASMKKAEDFVPLFKVLFRTYPYVWIFAAKTLGYNPYDPKIAPAFNAAIKQGLSNR
jgi:hypothetical protein